MYLYIVGFHSVPNAFKVGITTRPQVRLKELTYQYGSMQSYFIFKIGDNYIGCEKAIHGLCHPYHFYFNDSGVEFFNKDAVCFVAPFVINTFNGFICEYCIDVNDENNVCSLTHVIEKTKNQQQLMYYNNYMKYMESTTKRMRREIMGMTTIIKNQATDIMILSNENKLLKNEISRNKNKSSIMKLIDIFR